MAWGFSTSRSKGAEPSLTDYVLSYLNGKGDYLPEKEKHLHRLHAID